MNGPGKLFLVNGNVYDGMFVNGTREDYGTLYHANGDIYTGNLR